MFFLASLLRHEKDTQMLKYIHTLPNGRAKTALIKIIAINLSVFCSTILLYGSNLLYCKILYGLGPLCRSIQSVPAFNQSTLQITVGEYLILYLLIKSFVAIIIGDLVMLVIILPRTPYWGYLILLSLFLSQAIIHQIIPGSSKWNYTELIRANLPLQYKYLALSRIKESLINGVKRPRTSILYESGWLHFLGIEEFDAQRESLLITILCVAGLSYGFSNEKSIGIQQYFATMPKGRRELWKGRKKFVDLFCLIIALESFLASFIQSLMCGGLHQGLAPVYSINVFSWMPELPLVFLFLLIFSSRFVAIRMLGGIIVLISSFVHKPITSLFLSFASLSFTLLLSYWEYPQMKWLSIFPMIDSGRIISQSNQWGGIIASSFICIASIYLCNYICEKEHMKAALS